ncbi:hypothetical protein Tco_1189079, partial [Tanacetum coccineum]
MLKRRLNTSVQASVVSVKWRLLKITLQAPFLNVKKTFDHSRSSLSLHQMTSDHNRSELEIHDHSNEPSSSKLYPKVVPLAVKTATSRQELELLFHHHISILRTTDLAPQCQMMSDHNSSDLAPQCQMVSAENNTSGPAPFLNVQKTFDRSSSSLVQASFFMAMTSDHNRSELGIQDHSNEPSSSKLV